MKNVLHGYLSGRMLHYVSQVSNAVLVGGMDHPSRDSFNYEQNTSRITYQFDIPSPREVQRWCEAQANHPSFELSTAVLTFNH